ncbi:MAG TPA: helix-turn-helix domain-containing protein [Allosphingosinicella sp.]|jgi:excisionase family DNA binding protein
MLSNDLLDGAEAAATFTGLPLQTIYHLVRTGRLPATKMGRRIYFRKSEIEKAFSPNQSA